MVPDNDMVADRDPDQLSRFRETVGRRDIRPARGRFPGRMVVHQDHRYRVMGKRFQKNVPWLRGSRIDGSRAQIDVAGQMAVPIQEDQTSLSR